VCVCVRWGRKRKIEWWGRGGDGERGTEEGLRAWWRFCVEISRDFQRTNYKNDFSVVKSSSPWYQSLRQKKHPRPSYTPYDATHRFLSSSLLVVHAGELTSDGSKHPRCHGRKDMKSIWESACDLWLRKTRFRISIRGVLEKSIELCTRRLK